MRVPVKLFPCQDLHLYLVEMKPNSLISSSEPCYFAFLHSVPIILTRYGNPALVVAAVDAITQLLSKGSFYEHKKLMEAEVFLVAIRLHRNPSQRQLSLKLLYSIVSHLSHALILDEGLAEELLALFESALNSMIYNQF
jgi:hypothetical protein